MIVTCNKKDISDALSVVMNAIPGTSQLPVLANVLLVAGEENLTFSGTNLEEVITMVIPATVKKKGSFTLPARTLAGLVTTMQGEEVTLDMNPKRDAMTVTCKANKTTLKGIDAEEFPPNPIAGQNGVVVSGEAFREAVSQVVYCVSKDIARPQLTGVFVEISQNEIKFTATDGYRFAHKYIAHELNIETPISVIVPAKAIIEAAKFAKDNVVIRINKSSILFQSRRSNVYALLIEAMYPDINQVLPKKYNLDVTFKRNDMTTACRQVFIMAREGKNVGTFKIDAADTSFSITATSEETGTATSSVNCSCAGEGVVVSFNIEYILAFLENVKCDEVLMQIVANNMQARFSLVGDPSIFYVQMPMRKE